MRIQGLPRIGFANVLRLVCSPPLLSEGNRYLHLPGACTCAEDLSFCFPLSLNVFKESPTGIHSEPVYDPRRHALTHTVYVLSLYPTLMRSPQPFVVSFLVVFFPRAKRGLWRANRRIHVENRSCRTRLAGKGNAVLNTFVTSDAS